MVVRIRIQGENRDMCSSRTSEILASEEPTKLNQRLRPIRRTDWPAVIL